MPSRAFVGLAALGLLALALPAFNGEDFAPSATSAPAWRAFSEAPDARTTGFALSPDGEFFAESNDLAPDRIVVHGVHGKWAVTRSLAQKGLASELAFSPDGRFLAAGGHVAVVTLFDLRGDGNAPARVLAVPGNVSLAMAFSPDSRCLATATDDRGAIAVWELGSESGPIVLHGGTRARDLQFSPDGRSLAVAEKDNGTVRLWGLETGQGRSFETRSRGSASSVAFSPDGSVLAAVDDTGAPVIWLWDWKSGRSLPPLTGRAGVRYHRVVFSPDSRMLVTATPAGTVSFRDRATGSEIAHLESGALVPRLAFSADGRVLAVCGSCAPVIQLWRTHEILAARAQGGS